MRNFGPRHAIGVSWFFTLDDDALASGPTMRYRRWLKGRQSLDFGVGTPIAAIEESAGDLGRGSVFGLAKYNFVPWFGVAVRPEVLRRTAYDCEAGRCAARTVSTPRILVGIELSESPGATTSVIFGGLVGLLALAFSGAQ